MILIGRGTRNKKCRHFLFIDQVWYDVAYKFLLTMSESWSEDISLFIHYYFEWSPGYGSSIVSIARTHARTDVREKNGVWNYFSRLWFLQIFLLPETDVHGESGVPVEAQCTGTVRGERVNYFTARTIRLPEHKHPSTV